MPQIAVINESTAIADADVRKMLPAFQQQWNQDLAPVWGVDPATFTFIPKKQMPAAGGWSFSTTATRRGHSLTTI